MFAAIPAFHLLILLVLYVCSDGYRPLNLPPTYGMASQLFSSVSNSLSDAEKMKQAVGYKVNMYKCVCV